MNLLVIGGAVFVEAALAGLPLWRSGPRRDGKATALAARAVTF